MVCRRQILVLCACGFDCMSGIVRQVLPKRSVPRMFSHDMRNGAAVIVSVDCSRSANGHVLEAHPFS